jgi:rsbT co-antagonist protein RsbR
MPPHTQIPEILAKFQIEPADITRVRAAGEVLRAELPAHIASFYEWMERHREYTQYFADHPTLLARVKEMQMSHWHTFFDAELDERWFAARRHVGSVHAHIALPHDIYFAGMSMSGKSLVDRLRRGAPDIADADETANSLIKLVFLDTFVVIEEISRIQKEKIAASSKTLLEMSTPVTPIWEGILLLPLIGIIDSERTHDVMTKTLDRIAETRAKVFVLDISGVAAMDTAVANQLIKITKATQLMGCETIISGVSPAIARTLVELGVNIGEVRTTSTLRDSFELALRAVGVERGLLGTNGPTKS